MDIEPFLTDSSKKLVELAREAVLSNPDKYYDAMVEMAFSDDLKKSNRAARIITFINFENKELIKPYISRIIHNIEGMSSSKQMNFLYLLIDHVDLLDEEELGVLVSFCFDWMISDKATPGVKVTSLEILLKVTRKIPELKDELMLIIEDQLPKNTKAFQSRGTRALKILNEL